MSTIELINNISGKICHDIANDITVINNSLELITLPTSSVPHDLLYQSLGNAILRLKVFRWIYAAEIDVDTLQALCIAASELLLNSEAKIHNLQALNQLSLLVEQSDLKVLAAMFFAAISSLRSGESSWHVVISECSEVSLTTSGSWSTSLKDECAILLGRVSSPHLTQSNAHFYYTKCLLAESDYQFSITRNPAYVKYQLILRPSSCLSNLRENR